jgi:hypothetical protein
MQILLSKHLHKISIEQVKGDSLMKLFSKVYEIGRDYLREFSKNAERINELNRQKKALSITTEKHFRDREYSGWIVNTKR